jgi:hypothetical protein
MAAAEAWVDDRFYAYSSMDGLTASAWQIRMASTAAASDLAAAIEGMTDTSASLRDVTRIRGDVFILAGGTATMRRDWAAAVVAAMNEVPNAATATVTQGPVRAGTLALLPGGGVRGTRATRP